MYPINNPPVDPGLDEQRIAWRRERLGYPGWVVAPHAVQQTVGRQIWAWGNDVRKRVEVPEPISRLGLLREYAWRHRVAGLLLSDAEIDICEAALNAVDPAPQRLGLPDAEVRPSARLPEDLSWADVLDDWIHLALGVLENVRRRVDRPRFERWSTLLRMLPLAADAQARLHYESCRLALGELDWDAVLSALAAWPQEPRGFPFGLTWRACIQAELGEWDDAFQTAHAARLRIRDAQSASPTPSVALLSQEGWTRQLIGHAEQVVANRDRDYKRMRSVDYRWQRTDPPRCQSL